MSKQLKLKVVEREEPKKPEVSPVQPEEVTFEAELEVATKLHATGKHLQKAMLEKVSKNLPIDIAISQIFTNNLVSSKGRKPMP